jgi:error-prone DNA polymerase
LAKYRTNPENHRTRVPHLHVSTHFSFGIGVSSPETLATAAAERGFSALACTDTNGVYGAVEFQRACEAAGVRPILGAHLVTDDEEGVALATDERGWAALCRAITRIQWGDGKTERRKDGTRERLAGAAMVSSTTIPSFRRSVFPSSRLSV